MKPAVARSDRCCSACTMLRAGSTTSDSLRPSGFGASGANAKARGSAGAARIHRQGARRAESLEHRAQRRMAAGQAGTGCRSAVRPRQRGTLPPRDEACPVATRQEPTRLHDGPAWRVSFNTPAVTSAGCPSGYGVTNADGAGCRGTCPLPLARRRKQRSGASPAPCLLLIRRVSARGSPEATAPRYS
jgi:hypothetical protein